MPHRGIQARTLPASRNSFFSTPTRAWSGSIAPPAPPPPEYILACIDITEPLYGNPGEVKVVPYRYRAGYPKAVAFFIEWFFTQEDADALLNPLDRDIYALPTTAITPATPEPDTGEWQWGSVRLEIPETYQIGYQLYGAMIIEQPDFEQTRAEPQNTRDIL